MKASLEPIAIRTLDEAAALARIEALADLLIDCVAGGASVNFMAPLARPKAVAFWRTVAAGLDGRRLLVAEDGEGLLGSVQVVFAQQENQPHRADLAKMLVHRRARRRGIGAALLAAAERAAAAAGRSLLVLDTAAGGDAERLYARAGWTRVGVIPVYALMPDGAPCDATVFFKVLG